jgi:hypothetical protein
MDESAHVRLLAEVEQQSELDICAPQVVEQLPSELSLRDAASFDFYDQPILNQKIHAIRAYYYAVVVHGNRNLSLDTQSSLSTLVLESTNVHVLEKTKAELVIDGEERGNHYSR